MTAEGRRTGSGRVELGNKAWGHDSKVRRAKLDSEPGDPAWFGFVLPEALWPGGIGAAV